MKDYDFQRTEWSVPEPGRSGSGGKHEQQSQQERRAPRELLTELKGVSKLLDGKGILRRLNVQILQNRIIGLVGDNGQGKTTLLKLMAGILQPDEGKILRYTTQISYLMPRDIFYDWMRVKDAVQYYSLHYRNFREEKACGLIEKTGFDKKALLRKLSDGQRERLLLILAVCTEAELYLLDEPMSGADAAFKQDIRRFLMEYLPEGATIIMATHLLRDFEQLFDEVLFLDHGELIRKDTEELRETCGLSVEQYYLERFQRKQQIARR